MRVKKTTWSNLLLTKHLWLCNNLKAFNSLAYNQIEANSEDRYVYVLKNARKCFLKSYFEEKWGLIPGGGRRSICPLVDYSAWVSEMSCETVFCEAVKQVPFDCLVASGVISLLYLLTWGFSMWNTGLTETTQSYVFALAAPSSNIVGCGLLVSVAVFNSSAERYQLIFYSMVGTISFLLVSFFQMDYLCRYNCDSEVCFYIILSLLCAALNLTAFVFLVKDNLSQCK